MSGSLLLANRLWRDQGRNIANLECSMNDSLGFDIHPFG